MTKDKALNLALEALDIVKIHFTQNRHVNEAITAIKQARSAPVQEPVHQWRQKHSPYWYDGYPDNYDGGGPYETRVLYTTPPAAQRQWVGLTQQERKDIWREAIGWGDPSHDDIGLMIAIEAKFKEKNNG
jgi:hypothetical protein